VIRSAVGSRGTMAMGPVRRRLASSQSKKTPE
jgi:hypothetical protein